MASVITRVNYGPQATAAELPHASRVALEVWQTENVLGHAASNV
jgi:hypothetical protein